MRRALLCILSFQMLLAPLAKAEMGNAGNESFLLQKENPTVKSGSIFYSPNKKNEVLFKANIWGAVQFPGVHYMPLGTHFLDAISYAGGPLDSANVDQIVLSSRNNVVRELSVTEALKSEGANPVLQPDDIVVVKESKWRANANLYLSIGTFLVSVAALSMLVGDHNR